MPFLLYTLPHQQCTVQLSQPCLPLHLSWILPASQCLYSSQKGHPTTFLSALGMPGCRSYTRRIGSCMGSLRSVQAISSCAPTSLSFQASKVVPLPFAYLATRLVNITLYFLLALQIHIFAILGFFSFFLSYSILLFLRVNLGWDNLSLFQP